LAAGGEGIERDLLMLEDVTVSLVTERRASSPWGLWGGAPGALGENWLLPGGDESKVERLLDKCTIHVAVGDVLRMWWRMGTASRSSRGVDGAR
jgi:N-methylhydantoinase B/oxoprolinase/acetone carboxylase alpha subunit